MWQKENEAFYHALIHLTFSLAGVFVQSEVNSANGRLDALIETDTHIFIFEFKRDKSAEAALQQIEDKQYFQPYQNYDKQRVGIGVNFSKAKKEIANYKIKTF
ncbi:MAG: PD-(D/E)XK nuclease domain-containing protein [Saprospiraceae bacterium]